MVTCSYCSECLYDVLTCRLLVDISEGFARWGHGDLW